MNILKWKDAVEYALVAIITSLAIFAGERILVKNIPLEQDPPVQVNVYCKSEEEEDGPLG